MRVDSEGREFEELRRLERTLRDERPLLYLVVYPDLMRAFGDEPSTMHRWLADLGYVPECRDESDGREEWVWYHPDGERE